MDAGTISATLRLRDEMTVTLEKANKLLGGAGGLGDSAKQALATFGGFVGAQAALDGIKSAFQGSLGAAIDFNALMANVASLIPNSTARVDELKVAVQNMSVATGKSTADLAGGLYQVISAFGDTADSTSILATNAMAAAAGVAETTDAINLTSAVTKAYGDISGDAVLKAADLALMTVRLGQTTFPELASAMGTVTPIAASLKVSQEELFTALSTLTGVTGSANTVTTQLRGTLVGLQNPTDDMSAALEKMGFSSGEAALESLGLKGTLDGLLKQTGGNTNELVKLWSATESWASISALAGSQSESFTAKLAEMSKAAGTTDVAFKAQTEGINKAGFAWEQMKARVAVAMQKLGDEVLPKLLSAVNAVWGGVQILIGWWDKLPASAKNVTVAVVAVTAAVWLMNSALVASAGAAIVAFGASLTALVAPIGAVVGLIAGGSGVVASIALLMTPVGWATLAVSALAASVWLLWDPLKEAGQWLGDKAWAGFQATLGWINEKLAPVYEWFAVWGPAIGVVASWLGQVVWKTFAEIMSDVGGVIATVVGLVAHAAWAAFNAVVRTIATSIAGAWEGLKTFVGWIAEAAKWAADAVWSKFAGVFKVIGDAIDKVSEYVDRFKTKFKELADLLKPDELPKVESAWKGLGDRGFKSASLQGDALATVVADLDKRLVTVNATTKLTAEQQKKAAEDAKKLATALDEMSGKSLKDAAAQTLAVFEAFKALQPATGETYEAFKKLNPETTLSYEEFRKLHPVIEPIPAKAYQIAQAMVVTGQSMSDLPLVPTSRGMQDLLDQMTPIADEAMPALRSNADLIKGAFIGLAPGIQDFGAGMSYSKDELHAFAEAAAKAEERIRDMKFNAAFDGLGALADAAVRGGSTFTAFAATVGQALVNIKQQGLNLRTISDAFGMLGDVATATGHKTTAAVMNIAQATVAGFAQGGPMGAAIAGATALLASFSDKLFKTEGRKVNDLRDEFVAAAGGLAALNEKAHQAGMTLDQLLKASKVNDYNAAVKALNDAFGRQEEATRAAAEAAKAHEQALADLAEKAKAVAEEIKGIEGNIAGLQQQIADMEAANAPSWDKVKAAADKYGVSIDQLGPKVAQLKINDEAKGIIDAFDAMKAAGGDVGGVLVGMKDEINKVVQDSIKFGVDVPANMKPMIDELARSGQLLSAGGQGVVDFAGQFEKLGVKVPQDLDKVLDEIAATGTLTDDNIRKLGGMDAAIALMGKNAPDAAKPAIKAFQDALDLVEKNKTGLVDTKDLKWGQPVKTQADIFKDGMDALLLKLDELFTKLSTKLGEAAAIGAQQAAAAIGTIPTEVPVTVVWSEDGRPEPYDPGDGGSSGRGGQGYAGGTYGQYLDFGAGTTVTLHGRERVMTEAEGRRESAGAAFSDTNLLRELRDLRRDLPRAMTLAIQDARVLAWRA